LNVTDEYLKNMVREAVKEGIKDALIELGWKPERKRELSKE
jgi:2-iminoacetate synthase ThiH